LQNSNVVPSVTIIGAGPAGLTAAYLLTKAGANVTVLEADPEYVGGISRTHRYKGFSFDIGGHRFFSKSAEVEALWREILPNDFLNRPRSSRIYYGGKFFSYPLKPIEAFFNLGPLESIRCGLSYLSARLLPHRNPRSFQDWVSNKFGARLFEIFFKTYTEKVWGMSCRDISADWAAQRIKGLSLSAAVLSAFRSRGAGGSAIKSLIGTFRYPRRGPGMLWEECARKVAVQGGSLIMGATVTGCRLDPDSGNWWTTFETPQGGQRVIQSQHVVSSAPIANLIRLLTPAPSAAVSDAAQALRYRDFLTVAVIARDRDVFRDQWIYIHEPGVKVGRIQNFKAWSPEMVPDPALACYGLEYFCFEGDGLWAASDEALVELARVELQKLGLVDPADILDGCVVRQKKAYPVYDAGYIERVRTIRAELEAHYPNLYLVGRNGMHKYNNQDHSMMTAMLSARNILAGQAIYDVWEVNEDAEYHEHDAGGATSASGLRAVPRALEATRNE